MRRSCFAPVFQPLSRSACRCRLNVEAPGTAPGPLCLFHSTFIAIAGTAPIISGRGDLWKRCLTAARPAGARQHCGLITFPGVRLAGQSRHALKRAFPCSNISIFCHAFDEESIAATGPAPAPAPCSSTRCGSTCRRDFRLTTKKLTHARSSTSCCGSSRATPTSIPAGTRRLDLGRMGRRERRSGPGHGNGAAGSPRRHRNRPACRSGGGDPRDPGIAPADAVGLESGGSAEHGAAALHCCSSFSSPKAAVLPVYQRSADIFLGVPFNIARAVDPHDRRCLRPEAGGVCPHAWRCASLSQSFRSSAPAAHARARSAPQLVLHRVPDSIDDFTFEDFEITGYEAQPNIPAPIAV